MLPNRVRFLAGILQGALLLLQVCNVHRKYNIWTGEIEIKETLIAVILNKANCTVLVVQITLAKLGLTKLNLNPSGTGGSGA